MNAYKNRKPNRGTGRVRTSVTDLPDSHGDVQMILDFAIHAGYVLIGVRERVYIYTGERDEVEATAPAQDRAVHAFLKDGSFTVGDRTPYTHRGRSGHGYAVHVPRATKQRCQVWKIP